MKNSRTNKFASFIPLVVFMAVLGVSYQTHAAPPPLVVSEDGRNLVQANGRPFIWIGDTNWRTYKLSPKDVNKYISNRRSRGFNVLQGPVLLHAGVDQESVAYNGEGNTDPANPNIAYFEHIDYIISTANRRNMYIAPVIAWGDNAAAFNNTTTAYNFGFWVGERYKHFPNVIWIVAGEYLMNGNIPGEMAIWNAVGAGLKDGSAGNQLVTIHGSYQEGAQSSSIVFHNAWWLDFNMIQSSQFGNFGSGSANYELVEHDYNLNPPKPVIDGEANYEELNGWDDFGVRRRAYWSVFAGAFGHTYGANGLWQSLRAQDQSEAGPARLWSRAMSLPGARQMRALRRLMESRPMLDRVPDQNVLLSPEQWVPTHIRATRDAHGRYFMVYIPEANKEVTVNMEYIEGEVATAWWFDPVRGSARRIGQIPVEGSQTFTTPGNSADWVLVVDDRAQRFRKPGSGGPLP